MALFLENERLQIIILSSVTLFISKFSARTIEIFASRVTDSNLQIEENDQFYEVPIPSQFKLTLEGKTLKTEAVEHI